MDWIFVGVDDEASRTCDSHVLGTKLEFMISDKVEFRGLIVKMDEEMLLSEIRVIQVDKPLDAHDDPVKKWMWSSEI